MDWAHKKKASEKIYIPTVEWCVTVQMINWVKPIFKNNLLFPKDRKVFKPKCQDNLLQMDGEKASSDYARFGWSPCSVHKEEYY